MEVDSQYRGAGGGDSDANGRRGDGCTGEGTGKILAHHYYRLKAGGLACWWVQVQYSDGSKTNGFIDPLPLAESKVGRDMFKAYVATKKGAKMAKVVDF